jgi:hypothetical protein
LDILADSICHGFTIAEFIGLEITFPYAFCISDRLGFGVPNSNAISVAITLTESIAEYYSNSIPGSSWRSWL